MAIINKGTTKSREKKEELGYNILIKFEDLQVGHYLIDNMMNNQVVEIVGISESGRVFFYGATGNRHERAAHGMSRVPLTFDVLKRLGFSEIELDMRQRRLFVFKMNLVIDENTEILVEMVQTRKKHHPKEGTVLITENRHRVYLNGKYLEHIKHVHPLQTLYNGLTGKKLKFNF